MYQLVDYQMLVLQCKLTDKHFKYPQVLKSESWIDKNSKMISDHFRRDIL